MTLVEVFRKQIVGELCGRSSGLRTLLRYGLGMTGNRDDGEGGCGGAGATAASCAGWMEPLFLMLKAKMEEAAQKVCKTEIEDAAAAEKVARQIGVIARSAKAVEAMRLLCLSDNEEDEMGGRTYDPAEDERIRQELVVEHARLDRILEEKNAEAAERARAKAASQSLSGGQASGFAD
ncbi:hypothetical protein [Brevundimonas sp. G8]|uniref:hypothetical protein n=1 Tax=Brevundimonas sp. G8 TaxID=1350776 RepID=UPI0012F2060F|nr:hypothetical protein [Brevundimonas sp. G8]VXB70445.1 conserved hypothetical protein [Brevundimonas sp. G8]